MKLTADLNGREFIDHGLDAHPRYECEGETGSTIVEVVRKVLNPHDSGMLWSYDIAAQLAASARLAVPPALRKRAAKLPPGECLWVYTSTRGRFASQIGGVGRDSVVPPAGLASPDWTKPHRRL